MYVCFSCAHLRRGGEIQAFWERCRWEQFSTWSAMHKIDSLLYIFNVFFYASIAVHVSVCFYVHSCARVCLIARLCLKVSSADNTHTHTHNRIPITDRLQRWKSYPMYLLDDTVPEPHCWVENGPPLKKWYANWMYICTSIYMHACMHTYIGIFTNTHQHIIMGPSMCRVAIRSMCDRVESTLASCSNTTRKHSGIMQQYYSKALWHDVAKLLQRCTFVSHTCEEWANFHLNFPAQLSALHECDCSATLHSSAVQTYENGHIPSNLTLRTNANGAPLSTTFAFCSHEDDLTHRHSALYAKAFHCCFARKLYTKGSCLLSLQRTHPGVLVYFVDHVYVRFDFRDGLLGDAHTQLDKPAIRALHKSECPQVRMSISQNVHKSECPHPQYRKRECTNGWRERNRISVWEEGTQRRGLCAQACAN
jgi:hypothetical protein